MSTQETRGGRWEDDLRSALLMESGFIPLAMQLGVVAAVAPQIGAAECTAADADEALIRVLEDYSHSFFEKLGKVPADGQGFVVAGIDTRRLDSVRRIGPEPQYGMYWKDQDGRWRGPETIDVSPWRAPLKDGRIPDVYNVAGIRAVDPLGVDFATRVVIGVYEDQATVPENFIPLPTRLFKAVDLATLRDNHVIAWTPRDGRLGLA